MSDENKEYEELLDLVDQIDEKLDDIKGNVDAETYERITSLKEVLDEKHKDDSISDKLKAANSANEALSKYQGFLDAFQSDLDIDSGRLMALTDGIFSIVMTLLVFGLALPEIPNVTEELFSDALLSLLPKIGVTLVSFILIASFWVYHHEFIKIKTLNFPYLWFNIFFLICISFIPFTTSLIGTYAHFLLSELAFGLDIFLTLLSFMLMFWYANRSGFMERELSKAERKHTYSTLWIILGVTTIVNILDFTVSHDFFYLFLLVPIISTIRDIRFKMKHNI